MVKYTWLCQGERIEAFITTAFHASSIPGCARENLLKHSC